MGHVTERADEFLRNYFRERDFVYEQRRPQSGEFPAVYGATIAQAGSTVRYLSSRNAALKFIYNAQSERESGQAFGNSMVIIYRDLQRISIYEILVFETSLCANALSLSKSKWPWIILA